MKNIIAFLFLGLLACCSNTEVRTRAQGPQLATMSITGVDEALAGGFLIIVGPLAGQEEYEFTGVSGSTQYYVDGRFDLSGAYWVESLPAESTYSAPSGFDWVLEHRGSFAVTRAGVATGYLVDYAHVRIDSNGQLAAEFHGVEESRVDVVSQTILPGTDLVVTAQGVANGSCMTSTSNGPIVLDPTNSAPGCAFLRALPAPPQP